nr:hypothetical protein [Nonomuraea sp. SYSU D8015]
MVEHLPHGDRAALGQRAGQMPGDRVVEGELALVGELEHDDGHEGLGDAADPEMPRGVGGLARDHVAVAGRGRPVLAVPAHPDQRGRDGLALHQGVKLLFQGVLGGGGERGHGEGE